MHGLKQLFPTKKSNYVSSNQKKYVLPTLKSQRPRNESNHTPEKGPLTKSKISGSSQVSSSSRQQTSHRETNNESYKNIQEINPSITFASTNQISQEKRGDPSIESDMTSGYDLKGWGLPDSLVKWYNSKGIDKLFQWQLDCLKMDGVLYDGKNLIFSAPTSAGKTIVADILMLKNVLDRKKKAIIILPFVSVSREKMLALQSSLNGALKVGGFMGNNHPVGGLDAVDIAVCTIEKANNFINRLIQEGKLHQIGCLVVDELHMLGDPSRGYFLELLLSKLVYIADIKKLHIQIIGMSATLPNLDEVARWLKAELYVTDYRPVPFVEKIRLGEQVFEVFNKGTRGAKPLPNFNDFGYDLKEASSLVHILETLLEGGGVLVFCPSKAKCEQLAYKTATMISYVLKKYASDPNFSYGKRLADVFNHSEAKFLANQIYASQPSAEISFKRTIPFGVAFHHAGLSIEERDMVEDAFRRGILKVITATSTLSSGVNLPARRVIISSPMFYNDTMDILTYKQMVGRSGRKGIDTSGESILICTSKEEKDKGLQLVSSKLREITSALFNNQDEEKFSGSLQRGILDCIASGMARTKEEVIKFVGCTFGASNTRVSDDTIQKCIEYLVRMQFIYLDRDGLGFLPSKLGKAVLASSIGPDQALYFMKDLQKARRGFVLGNDLHILFEISLCLPDKNRINWKKYFEIFTELDDDFQNTSQIIGIDPGYLCQRSISESPKIDDKLRIHSRFFYALALNDLIKEMSLKKVSEKYDIPKGELQSFQTNAATFAGIVSTFCSNLGYDNLELIISQFRDRLQYGVKRELIDILKLSCLNPEFARALFENGLTTIIQIAHCRSERIEHILLNACPFEENVNPKYKKVWNPQLNKFLAIEEVGRMAVKQARELVEADIGSRISWSSSDSGPESEQVAPRATKTVRKKRKTSSISPKVVTPKKKSIVSRSSLRKNSSWALRNSLRAKNSSTSFSIPSSNHNTNGNLFSTPIQASHSSVFSMGNTISMKESNSSLHANTHHSSFNESNDIDSSSSSFAILNSNNFNLASTPSISSSDVSLNHISLNSKLPSYSSSTSIGNPDSSGVFTSISVSKSSTDDEPANLPFTVIKRGKSPPEKPGSPRSKLLKKSTQYSEEQPSKSSVSCVNPQLPVIKKVSKDIPFTTFFMKLKRTKKICFQADCKDIETKKHGIGSNLNFSKKSSIDPLEKGLPLLYSKEKCVERISIYLGGSSIYLFEGKYFLEEFAKRMKEFIENHTGDHLKIVVYDLLTVYKIFRKCFKLSRNSLRKVSWFDHRVATWLLNPDDYFNDPTCGNLFKLYVPVNQTNVIAESLCCYAYQSFKIHDAQVSQLEEKNLLHFMEHTEMKVVTIISESELVGILIDVNFIKHFETQSYEYIENLKKLINELAGEDVDTDNFYQVAKILYKKLDLLSHCGHLKDLDIDEHFFDQPHRDRKLPEHLKTHKKNLKVLSQYHSLPKYISYFRTLTTVRRDAKEVFDLSKEDSQAERRISGYSSYAVTGRILMDFPNMQKLAKEFVFEIGDTKHSLNPRQVLKAGENKVLLSADFSQVELRILAHFSKDELLIAALNGGEDIFKQIAAKIFHREVNEITQIERSNAKEICYGIVYGMGKKVLASNIAVDQKGAEKFKQQFMSTFRYLDLFMHKCQEESVRDEKVETLLGRYRLLGEKANKGTDSFKKGARIALNSKIQGSAADILRLALVQIEEEILKSDLDATLIMQLHDEVIYEVASSELSHLAKIIEFCMMNCANICELLIKLPVTLKVGKNWGQMEDIPKPSELN